MKKFSLLIFALIALGFCATNSFAASYSTSTAGASMTVTATSVSQADNLVFNPSPKVFMTGISSNTGFAHDAVHESALGQEGGQQYGMAADSNKVYYLKASNLSVVTTVTSTDSSFFSNNGWATMQ